MGRLTPNRWMLKPPPGTPLKSGLYAPDLIANAYNENYAGATVYNYAQGNVAGAARWPKSATFATPSQAGFAGGRFGPRVGVTNVNGVLTYTAGGVLTPTVGVTVMCGFRKRDATLRSSGAFGLNSGSRLGAHCPFSDGVVYWDWKTTGTGFRISQSGLTFGDDIWAFTMGPDRGQEIWQNGQLKASGTYGGARTADNFDFVIGNHNTTTADFVDWDFFYMWSWQIPAAVIQALSVRPFAVFEDQAPRVFQVNVAQLINETIALDATPALALANAVTAPMAIALDAAPALALATTIVAGGSVALDATPAIAVTGGLTVEEDFTLTATPALALADTIAAEDAITLSNAAGFTLLGGQTFNASITLSASPDFRTSSAIAARPGVFREDSGSGNPRPFRDATITGTPGVFRPGTDDDDPGIFRPGS